MINGFLRLIKYQRRSSQEESLPHEYCPRCNANLRLCCNENAMRYWALQYGPSVEVLEPASLRETIISDIHDMIKRYSD